MLREAGARSCDVFLSPQFMAAWDRGMNLLDEKYHFLASDHQIVSSANEKDKVRRLPLPGSYVSLLILFSSFPVQELASICNSC